MIDEKEAELKAEELASLEKQKKEIQDKIKLLKQELLEYASLENLDNKTWMTDNAYVEVVTKTRYKLVEVPADFKISTDIAAIDVAEKAFKSKVELSKEGKKMFKEHHPSIVKLMIPITKKQVKVVV